MLTRRQTVRHPIRVVLVLVSMALVVVGLQAAPAAGTSTKPVRIVIDRVFSSLSAPDGTPGGAVPYAVVVAEQAFSVQVSFYDADGRPAAFTKNTPLTLSTNTGSANQPSPAAGTAPGGATTATLTTTLARPANQVVVTVLAPTLKGPNAVAPGTSSPDQRFDVLAELRYEESSAGAAFDAGVGGDDDCASASRENPVCGRVLLPNGAQSSQVLLSRGLCDASYAGCGSTRGSVIQFLGDLGALYSPTAPAAVLVKCDKSLCGKGAISRNGLSYSLLGNAALAPAPACPRKNKLGVGQEACVDYVQSTRDNAGDTLLYLLLTSDARISVS